MVRIRKSFRIKDKYYDSPEEIVQWDDYNLNWYLTNKVDWWNRSDYYWMKYSRSFGNTLLDNICTAAKNKNIVIWAVGLEVTDNGADVMKKCASSPSHFFRVEGVELSEAFSAIARQINQLRLTQ